MELGIWVVAMDFYRRLLKFVDLYTHISTSGVGRCFSMGGSNFLRTQNIQHKAKKKLIFWGGGGGGVGVLEPPSPYSYATAHASCPKPYI